MVIEKSGKYLVSGESNEGYIVIRAKSIELLIHNLYLSSSKNSLIIVISNLKDVKITALKITTLVDLENPKTTDGWCAVIKVNKKSIAYFRNNDALTLIGDCKNIIKGGKESSIIFQKSIEEYFMNGNTITISLMVH